MNERNDSSRLISELMANAESKAEQRAIALLADARLFEDAGFRQMCVRCGAGINWMKVEHLRWSLPETDPRIDVLERSAALAVSGRRRPPETLEDLQVALDVDKPDGQVLAAWRDAYAADTRDPNPYHHHVDLCLDELRVRSACWDCGRPAADMTDDDLPVCSHCKEKN